MNKCIFIGRPTRDPEIRYGANNSVVAKFSLAVDRIFKREGEPDADFFNCTAFGKVGERVEKYLSKGMKIAIEGRIQNDNYTDKNGNKVYSTQIIVDNFEVCESKGSSNNQSAPAAQSGDGFMNAVDPSLESELPFL